MLKKYILILGGLIAISVIIALTLTRVFPVYSGPQDSTPTPSGLVTPGPAIAINTPSLPKMTDLAPKVPLSNKTTIIIRNADGSREGFLLPPERVDTFMNQLPPGDKIDAIIPPQSLMGHQPPLITPAPGNQTYPGTPGPVVGTPPSVP